MKLEGLDLSSIAALISVAILTIAAFSIVRVAVYQMSVSRRIENQASIQTGEGLEIDKTSIDWGVLEPAENKTENITATNGLISAIVLDVETANWVPPEAADFIVLSWDYNDQSLQPNQEIFIILTLSVSPDIENITTFTFDILINGLEKS